MYVLVVVKKSRSEKHFRRCKESQMHLTDALHRSEDDHLFQKLFPLFTAIALNKIKAASKNKN